MTQNNNSWRKNLFYFLPDQQYPLLAAVFCKMAIIFFYLQKTNSVIILTAATLIDFCRKPV